MALLDAVKQARERHRMTIEQTYEDSCTVVEYRGQKDHTTKITSKQEVVVLTSQPCKLSFSSVSSAGEGQVATVQQTVKLFLSPDVAIKVGSKITVVHDGIEYVYKNSGKPNIHNTHQEISLELFRGWA